MGQVTPVPSVLPIALRAYLSSGRERGARPRAVPRTDWGQSVLILDTETTVDPTQRLTFGSFRQGHLDEGAFVCLEEGLIYDDLLPERDPTGFACLTAYVAQHAPDTTSLRYPHLHLWSRTEFLNHRLWPAIRSGTLIVGYNLAFDVTRLGTHAAPARGDMFEGGFSITLYDYDAGDGQRRPNPHRPWFRCKAIDSKRTLMGFATMLVTTREKQRSGRVPGRLLDLRHLVFSLTDKKLSLESAAKAFGLSDAKLAIEGHGTISERYIHYNRQDVALTARLLEAVRLEWMKHPLAVAPERVMSPASIAKDYLRGMGITPPGTKCALPPEFLGIASTAFYGGRTEVRVRRTPVPVVHTDFRSMYPTVNSLLGLWEIITAADLSVVPDTAGVQAFLRTLTLERCFAPATWPEMRFFAKVLPAGDILPVRATYDDTRQDTCIGVNPLTSNVPIWVAGPDCVASFLLTGRVPRIVEAVRLVPGPPQEGLRSISLRGQLPIDPGKDDFFRRVIEMRHEVRESHSLPPAEQGRLERFLKVLANSGSYGIFAELNAKPQRAKPAPATLYGLEGGVAIKTCVVEEPGEFWCPPLAALTTAGARLMLALLERQVTDLGGHIAFGDTDSAAIVATRRGGLVPCRGGPHRLGDGRDAIRALRWDQVQEVIDGFAALNPYNPAVVPGSILRLEDQNFRSGRRRQLWAFAISAKRYALFERRQNGRIEVVTAKEHGLGHLYSPTGPGPEGRAWIPLVWESFIREAIQGKPERLPSWTRRPGVVRITVSSAGLMRPFTAWNAGKPYGDQIKPMNFGLSVTVAAGGHPPGVDPTRFHLLGVSERDPAKWLSMEYLDRYSGALYRIGVGPHCPGDRVRVKSLGEILGEYRVHPEPKSLGPDGHPCRRATVGLLSRRPVQLGEIVYIGKESNALEQVEQGLVHDIAEVQPRLCTPGGSAWDLVVRPALRRMPLADLATATGMTTRHLRYVREGTRQPSPDLGIRLLEAATRWAQSLSRHASADAEERAAADPAPVREGPAAFPRTVACAHGTPGGGSRLSRGYGWEAPRHEAGSPAPVARWDRGLPWDFCWDFCWQFCWQFA